MEKNQSAYREYHSTETTLIKVKYDILKVMDNQKVACLVPLDLLAAFDTVDHGILLTGLTICSVYRVLHWSGLNPTSQEELQE